MSTIVALPLTAAVPAIAPAMPAANEPRPTTCLERAEEIVDVLRTSYIHKHWKLDEEAAARALAFCRRYDQDGTEDEKEREAAIEFFYSHGQSLDWVLCGDHKSLIARLAHRSNRARRLADAELFALADEYVVAEQKWCALNLKVDNMRLDTRDSPLPEALRWRQEDADLGLPDIRKDEYIGREPAWDCKHFVEKLRYDKWTVVTRTGTNDDMTVHMRTVSPSPEAIARADEIIAAFDDWERKRSRRGLKKAERELKRATRECNRLEKQIAGTRAISFQGMMEKIRCAKAYAGTDVLDTSDGCAVVIAASIFTDIESLVADWIDLKHLVVDQAA